jgi:DNA-directed RNA polymerase alpha subunit
MKTKTNKLKAIEALEEWAEKRIAEKDSLIQKLTDKVKRMEGELSRLKSIEGDYKNATIANTKEKEVFAKLREEFEDFIITENGQPTVYAGFALLNRKIDQILDKIMFRENVKEVLLKSIDELDLGVRPVNALLNAGITTIGELVQKSEIDILHIKNMGRRSLAEIQKTLSSHGLGLNMKLDKETIDAITHMNAVRRLDT